MPSIDKPFQQLGYCTKACFAEANPELVGELLPNANHRDEAQPAGAEMRRLIQVNCRCGQTFDVPQMYAGARRPCPACGDKCDVPV
jgi:hypothetical protein